jgi:predicted amidophosphoribosyltransferase
LRYLHRLRSAELSPCPQILAREKACYEADLADHKNSFSILLQQLSWDVLVQAPSNKPHAKEFADVARNARKSSAAVVFHKSTEVTATKGAPICQLMQSFGYTPGIDFSPFQRVLLVDDVLAEGKTATAIILKLREAGLSASAHITIAVALRILTSQTRQKLDWRRVSGS